MSLFAVLLLPCMVKCMHAVRSAEAENTMLCATMAAMVCATVIAIVCVMLCAMVAVIEFVMKHMAAVDSFD